LIGRTISHYEIIEKLGEGGMGVVYRARDTRLGREVALKFLPAGLAGDEQSRERLMREARAAAALSHPNICTIHEVDEFDGQPFIAMECVEGRSLKQQLADGPLGLDDAVRYAAQMAGALAEAHGKGIVHRDVKPANVMITPNGEAKIMDFGLAKAADRTLLTREGTTLGTVAYMSPEQARGETVDHRTDIWSLGVVLYEMAAGRRPFGGEYDQAVIYSILNREPESLSAMRSDVPGGLERIVMKALSKDAGERQQSMRDVRDALESLRARSRPGGAKGGPGGREPSIAVLPFVNMSADPENEYFSDGLAEELINALAGLKGLRVVARTSSFRFRGKDTDIREIGRLLDVGSILEGSVRKSGTRLRITAQLINVDDGYHIWSERFDRELEDIFDIQDEIARAVAKKLEVSLSLGAGETIVKQYTGNIDAYSLYLKGLYNWNLMTPESWVLSRECLEQALKIDPGFAPAYAGLAVWYQSQSYWGEMPPVEAYEKSMENAKRALAIDDEMPLVHDVLACNYYLHDRDWPASEREFRRSLELDPTSSMSRVNYGLHLILNGRIEDALEQPLIAKRYDPLSVIVNTWSALILFFAGKVEDAIAQMKKTIEMEPAHWQPHYQLAIVYLDSSRFDETAREAEKAVELSGDASIALMILSCIRFLTGGEKEGREILGRLSEREKTVYVSPVFFAWIAMARGRPDEALGHVERAVEARDAWLNFNGIMPRQIRAQGPEIESLLKKTGWKE